MSDELPLTPAARLRPDAVHGTLVFSGGEHWVLAGGIPSFEPVWDRLYDQNAVTGSYDEEDLVRAGVRLLLRNFNLTPDEAVPVVVAADIREVKAAVETAFLGPEDEHRTYSDWARSALWANGINPASVPCDLLCHVLGQLVSTGRAVPQAKFVSSAGHAATVNMLRGFIRPPAPAPTPEPEPEPDGDAP